jgi:hypothetical protein
MSACKSAANWAHVKPPVQELGKLITTVVLNVKDPVNVEELSNVNDPDGLKVIDPSDMPGQTEASCARKTPVFTHPPEACQVPTTSPPQGATPHEPPPPPQANDEPASITIATIQNRALLFIAPGSLKPAIAARSGASLAAGGARLVDEHERAFLVGDDDVG